MSSPEEDVTTKPDALRVSPEADQVTGRCECCGQISRRVSGTIETADAAVAAYTVWWTVGHVAERGAELDLIIGRWGDGASPSDRFVIRLHHFIAPTGPAVMVQDASLAEGLDRLAAHALRRDDIIGTPRAAEVFALYDAIAQQDARLTELFGAPAPCGHCGPRAERRKLPSRRSRSGARRGRTI
ncbi:hypothetical protein DNX69_25345 [Rhodopseudomonas palustris]|uniref:Uncharacterized protein n=1 Tax=Rhodopseudomonas palustris TaxID=1076 RepID=A0A323UC43_RHOPL|nr:hypothetical protein [Rhodopseudomonas palustris]PZA09020.1 hypothetical protein DNX69_25345 [Rhodopseudomonas palustris]